MFFFFYSALLPWIVFPACLFQVQEFCFTQVWKGCWKLFSSDYCYTVSLLVLHFKATTEHLCPYFRFVNVLNLFIYLFYKILKMRYFRKHPWFPSSMQVSFFYFHTSSRFQVKFNFIFYFKISAFEIPTPPLGISNTFHGVGVDILWNYTMLSTLTHTAVTKSVCTLPWMGC